MKATTIGGHKLNKTVMFHTQYSKKNTKLAAFPGTNKQKPYGKHGNVFPNQTQCRKHFGV